MLAVAVGRDDPGHLRQRVLLHILAQLVDAAGEHGALPEVRIARSFLKFLNQARALQS